MERKLMRTAAIAVAISACISIVIASVIVRICLGTEWKFDLSPARIICGDAPISGINAFRRLTASDMSVMSAIPEREDLSIQKGRGADKLVDGSDKTLAEPGSSEIDYLIGLFEPQEIKQIVIYWGDYGINSNYIASWSLESSNDGSAWQTVANGTSPRDNKSVVNERIKTSRLRLRAKSAQDWIGAYEVEIIARQQQQ